MQRPAVDRGSFEQLPHGLGGVEFRWRARQTMLHGDSGDCRRVDVPDDAPEDVKEALGHRTLVANGGTCPCGAKAIPPNRAARRRAARRGDNIAPKSGTGRTARRRSADTCWSIWGRHA